MKERQSIVEPFKKKVIELLERGLSGVRIHGEIVKDGFCGSYSAVKKYIRKIKGREKIYIRIHTLAGEEAQVDFGYVGRTKDDTGKSRKTWVFNMRLNHSRYDYYEKEYDQKVETFINCHINAFEYFGGVPEVIKIDNLKAAILEANFYGPIYQRMYKEFSDYYGFKPIPCRIYHPNDKGKVESGIKYVKSNFFLGRRFQSGSDCDSKLSQWMQSANRRIHSTTKKVPYDVFFNEEEKDKLLPLPDKRYQLCQVGSRLVYHDCHVYIEHNYYSVPFQYVGKEVDIEVTDKMVKIYYNGRQITIHGRLSGGDSRIWVSQK